MSITGVLILLLFSAPKADAESVIRVRPYVELKSNTHIRLGDLLDYQNVDKNLKRQLSNIELGNAPRHQEKRTFTSRALSLVFRKKVSKEALKGLRIVIPKQVTVVRESRLLNEKNLRKRLIESWKHFCNNCTFDIKHVSFPQLGESVDQWRIDVGHSLSKGSFNLPLEVVSQGQTRKLWLQGQVRILKSVPVAAQAISRQETISKSMIRNELRDVTFSYDTAPPVKAIVGQKPKVNMKTGDIFWKNSLQKEKALNRGEIVKLHIRNEQFELSLRGIAQSDGYLGDKILVKNMKTQKLVSGWVTGKGEVRIR